MYEVRIKNARLATSQKGTKLPLSVPRSPAAIVATVRVGVDLKWKNSVSPRCLGARPHWKRLAHAQKWAGRRWKQTKIMLSPVANEVVLVLKLGLG